MKRIVQTETIHKRVFASAAAVLLVANVSLAHGSTRTSSCTSTNYGPYVCDVRLLSHSIDHITLASDCGRPRGFYAADRSKRVDLHADGAWIAPGVVRMRAYGSPLGALRVVAKIRSSTSIVLRNRSRFSVIVLFKMDCPP